MRHLCVFQNLVFVFGQQLVEFTTSTRYCFYSNQGGSTVSTKGNDTLEEIEFPLRSLLHIFRRTVIVSGRINGIRISHQCIYANKQ